VPSTVYKGDLTEISFGHETELELPAGFGGSFQFVIANGAAGTDTSTLTLTGGADGSPINGGELRYPVGMLVGCEVAFSNLSGTGINTEDNMSVSGRRYTIVKHVISESSTNTVLHVTPQMRTTGPTTVDGTTVNGTLHISAYKLPTLDEDSEHDDDANNSSESVLTDQFVGLINTISLPETKVDLKRYHVIGLGRDVAVQVPGRFVNTGGQFEATMHNARWLYYALGQESINMDLTSNGFNVSSTGTTDAATVPGQGLITHASGTMSLSPGDYVHIADTDTIPVHLHKEAGTTTYPTGDETALITDAQKNEIRRVAAYYWNSSTTKGYIWLDDGLNFAHSSGKALSKLDYTTSIAPTLDATTRTITRPVDRMVFAKTIVPSFALEVSVRRNDNQDDDGGTAEVVDGGSTDAKQLTRVFRGCKVKEFSMTADTDAAVRLSVGFDAALCYTDTGRLEGAAATATLTALSKSAGEANTRVLTLSDGTNTVNFAIDNSLTTSTATKIAFGNANSNANQFATNIAAAVNAAKAAGTLNMVASSSNAVVTLTQDDNSSLGNTTPSGTAISDSVITLTAAFSGGKYSGDRYNVHRLFEDTANTTQARSEAGIAKGTQKPFMFYNGTVDVGGIRLGQVVSFDLKGKTGVEQFYTISGNKVADSETDQIPFAGARNASIAVEGKTEYELDMEIIVDDPTLYHQMRRAVDNSDDANKMVSLSFTKQGTEAASGRESMTVVIDDYYIVEAPLTIPEDKGPMRSKLKVMPKSIRVFAQDTVYHY